MNTEILVEKYRPKTLDDLVIDDDIRKVIENYGKDIPHLLLTGIQGTGKTTLARIIVNDILKCDHLYINASDENGVDTIREKVIGFAQTKSFDGGIKVVILDEGDYLGKAAQGILRNVIETHSSNTRFIITGNYRHRIIPPLQSRCQSITLHTTLKDVTQRCIEIIKAEKIKIPTNQKKNLLGLIKTHYPDIRKCINEISKYSTSGTLLIETKKDTVGVVETIYKNLKSGDTLKTRKFLIENEELFDSDHESLLKDLLNHLYEEDMDEIIKKQAILIIADHLFKMVSVTDREICCIACLLQIEEIIA